MQTNQKTLPLWSLGVFESNIKIEPNFVCDPVCFTNQMGGGKFKGKVMQYLVLITHWCIIDKTLACVAN